MNELRKDSNLQYWTIFPASNQKDDDLREIKK